MTSFSSQIMNFDMGWVGVRQPYDGLQMSRIAWIYDKKW
jgi:hypothetical protein